MGKVIIPKSYVEVTEPLIFLAGPIRSAPNWQDDAIEYLLSQNPGIVVANPWRGVRDGLAQYVIEGDETYFSRQRAWERHYLDIASRTGAIMFWLPGEEKHNCEKVYGAMTRVEIGQWMTNYRHDNTVRFCVGGDGRFPELHTIKYDLEIDAPEKNICSTLEETCDEALRLANRAEQR